MNPINTSLMQSQLCTQEQLESKVFQEWAVKLGEMPGHIHRKVWEWCFICQALYERNLLNQDKKGMGFAVGTEPLPSFFCSFGASICASDIYPDDQEKLAWVETNQHASDLEALNSRGLCEENLFKEKCSFKFIDMNKIPDDLGIFDFVWSSCSMEHLGNIELGIDFIHNAMNLLKPGGFAIHTTEYNFSSNTSTVTEGRVVLFRKTDIERIVDELRKNGHSIHVDFSSGDLPYDNFIDVPPYSHNPHLKLQLGEYVITSIGLIIQKGT
jgi:hypothetical protein